MFPPVGWMVIEANDRRGEDSRYRRGFSAIWRGLPGRRRALAALAALAAVVVFVSVPLSGGALLQPVRANGRYFVGRGVRRHEVSNEQAARHTAVGSRFMAGFAIVFAGLAALGLSPAAVRLGPMRRTPTSARGGEEPE
jgi:hypothetical protein